MLYLDTIPTTQLDEDRARASCCDGLEISIQPLLDASFAMSVPTFLFMSLGCIDEAIEIMFTTFSPPGLISQPS